MIKYIIHGVSPYQDTPLEIRAQMLEAVLKTMGIKYTTSELVDLGEAVIKVQQNCNDSLMGFLKTNKGLVKQALSMMGKGNDRLKLS